LLVLGMEVVSAVVIITAGYCEEIIIGGSKWDALGVMHQRNGN
jgi:hypothetical protein